MLSRSGLVFSLSITLFIVKPVQCGIFAYDPAKDPKNVCFEEVGCFSMESPWKTFIRPVPKPDPPSKINLKLKLVTSKFPFGENITLVPYTSGQFNPMLITVFIAHGYGTSLQAQWPWRMARAYLSLVEANIFLIDWADGATQTYLKAASNIRVVAAQMASYIFFLQVKKGLQLTNVHLIGHSLGAHLCAYIAKAITTEEQKVDRITGLDPSQALFEGAPPEVRLAETDANYVDVIHTDAKPVTLGGLGIMATTGTVDFYVNSGFDQPGCLLESVSLLGELLTKKKYKDGADPIPCSHYRSIEIYIASLEMYHTSCRFIGKKPKENQKFMEVLGPTKLGTMKDIELVTECTLDTCLPIDLRAPLSPARGVFYVETDNDYPFCIEIPEKDKTGTKEVLKIIASNQLSG